MDLVGPIFFVQISGMPRDVLHEGRLLVDRKKRVIGRDCAVNRIVNKLFITVDECIVRFPLQQQGNA